MLLAMAVLMIHPQLAATMSLSAEKAAMDAPAAISASTSTMDTGNSMPTATASFDATTLDAATLPAGESSAALPDAPVPVPVNAPAPIAFLKPGKPFTVSVSQLRAENRRKELLWKGLAVGSSGAATFDALSTRHAITTMGAVELNPLLRPFAGNASLFAAIQVGPALMDFAGKKMMYSRHSWVRRMWWVPQSASFVGSIFCGAHNLSYH
jgi:hypothetical protein